VSIAALFFKKFTQSTKYHTCTTVIIAKRYFLDDNQRFAMDHPASFYNKQPILEVIQRFIPPTSRGALLELASGQGEHAEHFGAAFPNILFQPTDVVTSSFDAIVVATKHLDNVKPPVVVDCASPFETWSTAGIAADGFDFACCINMLHIAPWACAAGLFAGVSRALKPYGLLFTYGPYNVDGKFTHESNEAFDSRLKKRNPLWGVRDIGALQTVAEPHGIILVERVPMPYDNFTLIWRKASTASATTSM
jgi:SAM-dependent methyltransferase